MKISVCYPQNEITPLHRKKLSKLGTVTYTKNRRKMPVKQIINLVKASNILAIEPDMFGGFENAKDRFTTVMKTLPDLKGLALSTTSYDWVDLKYCKHRHIPVCNIPGYSRESVAEHTITYLLCLAKRIIVTDRKIQKGKFKFEKGFELKDKTLGIIGLGNIGSRVAQLAQGIGMKVIAYNRSPRKQTGVTMKSLNQLLKQSDAISINVSNSSETKKMLTAKHFKLVKPGVIIVNTVDKSIIDEHAMAKAVKKGKVYGYIYEGNILNQKPLANLENVFGFKHFGWYTVEALNNLMNIWIDNIKAIANNNPQNVVN